MEKDPVFCIILCRGAMRAWNWFYDDGDELIGMTAGCIGLLAIEAAPAYSFKVARSACEASSHQSTSCTRSGQRPRLCCSAECQVRGWEHMTDCDGR